MMKLIYWFRCIQAFLPAVVYFIANVRGSHNALLLQEDLKASGLTFFNFMSFKYNRNLFYHRFRKYRFLLLICPQERTLHCPIVQMGGVIMCHSWNTMLNAGKIGKNFTVYHNVTIGQRGENVPIIGDNVFIGTGAIVLGGITIGNNVRIAAGSVVVKDVPCNCTVAGNPAVIIRTGNNDNRIKC